MLTSGKILVQGILGLLLFFPLISASEETAKSGTKCGKSPPFFMLTSQPTKEKPLSIASEALLRHLPEIKEDGTLGHESQKLWDRYVFNKPFAMVVCPNESLVLRG